MAGPYTLGVVVDVPAGGTSSLLADQRGRTLLEPSRVICFANREGVDVLFNSTVGAESVTQDQAAAINTVLGDVPSTRDDKLFDTFGFAGDEIVIRAANSNAAGQEARVTLFIIPVDDNELQRAGGGFNPA